MKTMIMAFALTTTCLAGSNALATPVTQNSPFKAGDVMVRARVMNVMPHENSSTSVGGDVSVDNNVIPELDASYFFTPNISVEAIAGVTKHNLNHSSGADAGSAWLLPPTVTVQYHVTEWKSFLPYVGAGINYAHFYDEKGGALGSVKYRDSFGPALQVGVDVPISGNWYANADVKKLFVSTKAKFDSGVTAKVDIDPWIIGAGLGYKF